MKFSNLKTVVGSMKKYKILSLILGIFLITGSYFFSNKKVDNREWLRIEPYDYEKNREAFEKKGGCLQYKINNDPPDEYVKYTSQKYGIEFKVPYNKNWGSQQYKVYPYEEWTVNPVRINFGPLKCNGTDGWWSRPVSLYISPLFYYHDQKDFSAGPYKATVETKKVNDLDVLLIKYNGQDNADEQVIILGKKYDYVISCNLKDCVDADSIYNKGLDIIRSIKLLD